MSNKRMEAVGHAALGVAELKSALEYAEGVTGAVMGDGSIIELVAPAATDAAAAFAHLRNAMDCANADEETTYGIAGMGPGEWEKIARFLWGLLDNSDTLDDAWGVIESWRTDYNEQRPHSALGNIPPAQYVANLMEWASP